MAPVAWCPASLCPITTQTTTTVITAAGGAAAPVAMRRGAAIHADSGTEKIHEGESHGSP
jgi:hypothetical protein